MDLEKVIELSGFKSPSSSVDVSLVERLVLRQEKLLDQNERILEERGEDEESF